MKETDNTPLVEIDRLLKPATSTMIDRYIIANHWTKGKKVIDAATGKGYGAGILLSLGAKSVLGIDIDEDGVRVGSHVRCFVKKSRFGSEGRDCEFKIMWGSEIGIQDEESWLEILKRSKTPNFSVSGAWYSLTPKEGKPFKFQSKQWIEKLKDEAFRNAVIALLNEVMVEKYKS